MKQLFAILQILLVYFGFIPQSLSQVRDSLIVQLSLPEKEIKANKIFPIDLRIESKRKRILEIPKEAIWGNKSEGLCFFSIEIQKKTNGEYRDLKWNTRVDVPLSVDIDTLHYNDFRDYTFPINELFVYDKGEYRIRVLCLFSSVDNERDVYTQWAYFSSDQEMKGL